MYINKYEDIYISMNIFPYNWVHSICKYGTCVCKYFYTKTVPYFTPTIYIMKDFTEYKNYTQCYDI